MWVLRQYYPLADQTERWISWKALSVKHEMGIPWRRDDSLYGMADGWPGLVCGLQYCSSIIYSNLPDEACKVHII